MRKIGEILILIDSTVEQIDKISSIIESGCDANDYTYEPFPADDSCGFGAYYKITKEA